jgi:hypothetical protein
MYSSPHYSSVPFCDHTLPHQPRKVFSHLSSPHPTLPHRACYRSPAEIPQNSRLLCSSGGPIKPPKSRVPSVPGVHHVRVSSRRYLSQPAVTSLSPSPSLSQPAQGIEKRRLGPTPQEDGLFQLVLKSTHSREASLPLQAVNDSKDPLSQVRERKESICRCVGRNPASTPRFFRTSIPGDNSPSSPAEVHKLLQMKHRKTQSLPQTSLPDKSSATRIRVAKHDNSLGSGICIGGAFKAPSSFVPPPEPLHIIQPSSQAKPRIESPRQSVPLRLFPPSPTSSVASTQSAYPETISSVTTTFHPSLNLQHQVSVFEDDDEELGLMDYFKLRLPRKTRSSQRKRGCNWRRLSSWNCAGS